MEQQSLFFIYLSTSSFSFFYQLHIKWHLLDFSTLLLYSIMEETIGPEVTSRRILPETQVRIVQFWLQILQWWFSSQSLLWAYSKVFSSSVLITDTTTIVCWSIITMSLFTSVFTSSLNYANIFKHISLTFNLTSVKITTMSIEDTCHLYNWSVE